MEKGFTTVQLAKIIDKPQRVCIDWTEQGLFRADLQPAAGYASRREFSYAGVLRACLAVHFQEAYGFVRKKIKDLVEVMWDKGFFHKWAAGFPEADGFLEVSNLLSTGTGGAGLNIESQGGCLFLINPNRENLRILFYPFSLETALNMEREDIKAAVSGIHDMIALNLFDLKNEVDGRIAQI